MERRFLFLYRLVVVSPSEYLFDYLPMPCNESTPSKLRNLNYDSELTSRPPVRFVITFRQLVESEDLRSTFTPSTLRMAWNISQSHVYLSFQFSENSFSTFQHHMYPTFQAIDTKHQTTTSTEDTSTEDICFQNVFSIQSRSSQR